jgi:trans-aconitate methyltransferase
MFDRLLASDWFPAVASVHDRLAGDPPARVADLACGLGRSSLAIARGYPKVTVDGLDLDRASIAPRSSAPSSCWTPATSSASTTASASCTASRSAWSARTPREPAP